MPRRYKRKEGVRPRVVSWTTEALQDAFDEMDKDSVHIVRKVAARSLYTFQKLLLKMWQTESTFPFDLN